MSTTGGYTPPAAGDATTVADTPTLDLTEVGDQITGDVKVSAAPGNQLSINPDGLFVPAGAVDQTTVSDTNTVNLTETGNDITADVIVSPDPGNTLVAQPNGLFVPPVVPECPYAPRMTRAAALALRAAGSLKENCVVVITDGPTIGVGTTSVTEIELQPTTPSDLGEAALVHTTFDNVAWVGVYDIDANSITKLTDSSGNTVVDTDATAPTVHTQFPWHLGTTLGGTFRDNYIEDSTLNGWAANVGSVVNNDIRESTVTLSSHTAGAIDGNKLRNSTLVASGNFTATRNQFDGATFNGTPGITTLIQDNTYIGGTITVGTGNYASVRSRFTNHTFTNSGSGSVQTFNDSVVNNYNITRAAGSGGAINVASSRLAGGAWTLDGTITLSVNASQWDFANITAAAGSSRSLSITGSKFANHNYNIAASATAGTPSTMIGITVQGGSFVHSGIGGYNLQNSTIDASTLTIAGNGNVVSLGSYIGASSVGNVAGAAIRGIEIDNSILNNATVSQQRTLNTAHDQIIGARISNSSVTVNGAGGGPAGTQQIVNGGDIGNGSVVTIQSPNGANSLNNTTVDGATVTIPTNAFFVGCRLANGAVVTTGAFVHTNTIIELAGATNLTAANTNRLRNKSFSDVI